MLFRSSDLAGTNREEASATTVGDFSPAPVVGATRFCGETATLSFNSDKSRVLHAEIANQRVSINVGSGGSSIVEAGWATVTPKAATSTKTSGVTVPTAPSPQRVTGLPVIGYSATSFSNGATNGNFGSAIEHRYRR